MTDNEEQGAAKDIPPWLQPVPEVEEEGGFFANRKATLITAGVAVVLLTVFVAAIFTLYEDTPSGEPRRIVAEEGPVRTKPDDPGGMEVAFQDKEVFDAANGVPAGGRVTLGAEPEQPVSEIPDIPEDTATPKDTVTNVAAEPASNDAIGDIAEAVTGESVTSPDPKLQPTAQNITNSEVGTEAVSEQAPTATEPVIATTAPTDASAYRVQLGAYGSEAGAETAWRAARGKFPNQLSTLTPSYEAVSSGGRTLYRLRLGPISSRGDADQVCIALRAQQQACIVVNPT